MDTQQPEVQFSKQGTGLVVELNRPAALNALSEGMIRAILERLRELARDPGALSVLVLRGAGDRAFCAGGDVRRAVEHVHAGAWADAWRFFATEYEMDFRLHHSRVPVVSLIDGITMGGGAGIAMNGAFQVATGRTVFAMPELQIGLFPDVGASHFLNRAGHETGMWLALSGHRLNGSELVHLGLASHYLEAGDSSALVEALCGLAPGCGAGAVRSVLDRFCPPPSGEALRLDPETLAMIRRCFRADRPEAILTALEAESSQPICRAALDSLATGAPSSFAVTVEMMRRMRDRPLADCLRLDYRLVQHALRWPDFAEGIRARLVEKDHRPAWQPPELAGLDRAAILARFEQTAEGPDLELPEPHQA